MNIWLLEETASKQIEGTFVRLSHWLPSAGIFFFFFNLCLVDLQFCVNFSCTVKLISYTYTYIHSRVFLDAFCH